MTDGSPFWKEFSFPSPVDDILKKPNFTLEEILDEDETVIDIRSQKDELKNYFLNDEILTQLIKFIIEDPSEDATENRKFRYPVVACEILTAEIGEIDEALVGNDGKYLEIIFGFFHTDPEKFNVLLANLCVKLIISLLSTHLLDVVGYLKKNPNHITKIIDHLDCSTTTDLVVKLITCEEESYEGKGTQAWLVEIGLIPQIIKRLEPEYTYLHVDLPITISEILMRTKTGAPILQDVMNQENINLLFDLTLQTTNPSGFRHGMNMVNQILRLVAIEQAESDNSVSQTTPLINLPPVVQVAVKNIDKLYTMLESPLVTKQITNQKGENIEAFGFYRLVILQCFDALVHLNFDSILIELIKHESFFIYTLNLFFNFSTNNFCHKFVERIFLTTITFLNGQPLIDFLEKIQLIQIMLTKEEESKDQQPSPHFVPFLQNIGLLVEDKSMSNDQLYNYLVSKEGWEAYATRVRNERQSIEPRDPYEVDNTSSEGYGSAVSIDDDDEDISDEPNDADDYDTEQAEVLLTKEDIEAIG